MSFIEGILNFIFPNREVKILHAKENANWGGRLPFSVYKFYWDMDRIFNGNGNPFSIAQIRDTELRTRKPGHISSTMNIWMKSPGEVIDLLDLLKSRIVKNSSVSCLINGHIVIFYKDSTGILLVIHSENMTVQDFFESNPYCLNRSLKDNHVA